MYRTYYMQVYSYIVTLVRNASLAEEITQQTFFKAASSKGDFRKESGEFTWLCAIAKNLAADELRRNARTGELPQTEPLAGEDFVQRLEERDTLLRIHALLHELKEPYKEVFQLRIFGELSFAEIASIFGKSENWARVTYHRARLKIQERMDEDGK